MSKPIKIPNLLAVKNEKGDVIGVAILYNTNPPDPREGEEMVSVAWIAGGVSNVALENLGHRLEEIEVVEKKKWYSPLLQFLEIF